MVANGASFLPPPELIGVFPSVFRRTSKWDFGIDNDRDGEDD